jgi:hypothetical protein
MDSSRCADTKVFRFFTPVMPALCRLAAMALRVVRPPAL